MALNQALIFGASGISGWGLMRECLTYPTKETFSRVIGLTNRPLSANDAMLPDDKRWELHSGMDLSKSVGDVVELLKAIEGIEATTHVYFASYVGHGQSKEELFRANVQILETAVKAVETLCPDLKFWTLQTGGKVYGVEFLPNVPYNPPLKESAPRAPEPYASKIFYYGQYDVLQKLSQGKSWSFVEIRPDAIVGFVPQNNAMNLAQALGLWLAMWRSVEGEGAEVPFPGNEQVWKGKHTDTSQDILARFHIWSSLQGEKVRGKAFNVADEVVTWEQVWDGICGYFGLKGVGPGTQKLSGTAWVEGQKDRWSQWVKENGLKEGALEGTGWLFMAVMLEMIPIDRQYDLTAMRAAGFEEGIRTVEGYHTAFERMREAKIIP